jgi:PBP1b-binding outer membrane lipoprotein LpoB
MKKTSFVVAILASALLAGACSKKKDPAAPTTPAAGSDMPAAGSGMTPDAGSAAGSGSAAM